MIVEEGKYYLYRHIRLDKNEPFYIGVGTKHGKRKDRTNLYSRAYARNSRNKIWKDITNKSSFRVEILMESNDYDFILRSEAYFIKLYGRIFNHTGCLSNIDPEGFNTIDTSKNNSKKVYCYNNRKWYDSRRHCAEELNMCAVSISRVAIGKNTQVNGFYFGESNSNLPLFNVKVERLPKEIFKDVTNFEGCYMVSNFGRILSIKKVLDDFGDIIEYREFLRACQKTNYKNIVNLKRGGNSIVTSVSKLVYDAFIQPIPENMIVGHKDNNPDNYELDNLFAAYRGVKYNDCGVYKRPNGKYFARYVKKSLGTFNTKEEAVKFRNEYLEKIKYEGLRVQI